MNWSRFLALSAILALAAPMPVVLIGESPRSTEPPSSRSEANRVGGQDPQASQQAGESKNGKSAGKQDPKPKQDPDTPQGKESKPRNPFIDAKVVPYPGTQAKPKTEPPTSRPPQSIDERKTDEAWPETNPKGNSGSQEQTPGNNPTRAAGDPEQKQTANPQATTGETAADSSKTTSRFDEQFWGYLRSNNYKNWAPVPGSSGDFYQGNGPHGDLLKMYLNRTAAGSPATLPSGSVIIKENYGPDKSLKAITVMYRSKGYNPQAGDWYWIKYNPDGTTATDPNGQRIAGVSQSCIECHTGAQGDDHVFFNDR